MPSLVSLLLLAAQASSFVPPTLMLASPRASAADVRQMGTPPLSRAMLFEHGRRATAGAAATFFLAATPGAASAAAAMPDVVKVTDDLYTSDIISDAAVLARVGDKMKTFVTLCRKDEPCVSPIVYSQTFPTKPVLQLPLGPGLFEVAPTLMVVRGMANCPKPILVSCTTRKRSSGLAAIYVAVQRGYGGDATIAWAKEQRMPFLEMPAVRQWVIACVEASRRGGDEYCASM